MWKSLPCIALLGVALLNAPASFGNTIYESGTFAHDDDMVVFQVFVPVGQTVTIQTLSFADGSVGFEPILTIFDPFGAFYDADTTGGTTPGGCGARGVDSTSGYCLDAYLSDTLTAGIWTVVLTENDNAAIGTTLLDGFTRSGQGDFTGMAFGTGTGSFLMVDGSQRTSTWELQLSGTNIQVVPEPGTAGMLTLGTIALAIARRKMIQNGERKR